MANGTNGGNPADLAQKLRIPRNAVVKREELKVPQVTKTFAVFLDISGYTPFTESIIRIHKDRGIGQLVEELDKILLPAANAAISNRGNIIAVEGDALQITFDSLHDAFCFCKEISPYRRSIARTPNSEYPLLMDIGIAGGNLYEFIAESGGRRAYIACGSALREAYKMERFSKEGNITTNFSVKGGAQENGFCAIPEEMIRSIPEKKKESAWKSLFGKPSLNECDDAPDQEYLSSFLSSNLPPAPRFQLLSPVIIFSEFPLIRLAFCLINPKDGSEPKPGLASQILTTFYFESKRIIETHAEGYVDKFKDDNSMFLIGAPLTSEDLRVRAFEAMAKVHDLHSKLLKEFGLPTIPSASGMHKGIALCGPILGRYTAIGNSVNLAARIKSSNFTGIGPESIGELEGERRRIRFTRDMYDERVARFVRGYEIDHLKLKGIEDTQTIFGFSTITKMASEKEDYVLRKVELESIVQIARSSFGMEGKGMAINLIGNAGSGKDRLLSLVANELETEYPTYEIRCTSFYKKEPYRALFELMKKVENCFSDEELFTSAIGKKPESGKEFSQMLGHFRSRLITKPGIYLINNGDNLDRESADFLSGMSQDLAQAGCFIAHSGSASLFGSGANTKDILLSDLTREETESFSSSLAGKYYPNSHLSEKAADEIFMRSKGNPMFVSELVKAMVLLDGRLSLRKKLPDTLKDMMIRNVQDSLSDDLQEILEKYSLMHSVAIMAPFLVHDAKSSMDLLQLKGFLRDDFEFASDMLQKAIAESINPKRKADICLELAKAAEEQGLSDHQVIFEYYKNAPLTSENRQKALEHADLHVKKAGLLYLVRDDLFDDAIDSADMSIPEQRHICGMMLYRKSAVIMAQYTDNTHPQKIVRMEKLLDWSRESQKYLDGHRMEYKALLQVARSLSYLAYFETLEQKDKTGAKAKLEESKNLFEKTRAMALNAGDFAYYLASSSNFAHALIYHHKNPAAAFKMLLETEDRVNDSPSLAADKSMVPWLTNLYMNMAEAAQTGGDLETAAQKIEMALGLSLTSNYTEGIAYAYEVKARICYELKDYKAARGFAELALGIIGEDNILTAECKKNLHKIIDDVKRRKTKLSGKIG